MNPWKWIFLFCCIFGQNFGCQRDKLPKNLRQLCICMSSTKLVCKNIDHSSAVFQTSTSINDITSDGTNPFQFITELVIEDSTFKSQCLNPEDFSDFETLNTLSVINSGLSTFLCNSEALPLSQLKVLDLSRNHIRNLDVSSLSSQLVSLNVSHNLIQQLGPSYFAHFSHLVTLDLSNNKLNENVDPTIFKSLPKSLKHLDISSKLV